LHRPQLPRRSSAEAGSGLSVLSGVLCGNNVAEFEDGFEPESDDSFVTDFVVRSVARNAAVITTDRRPHQHLSRP